MKTILMVLLAGSTLVCSCCRVYKSGEIICDKKSPCGSLTVSNGLYIRFKYVDYFFSRRNVVSFICDVENNSGNRLVFDQQPFSIVSKEYEYRLMPQSIRKNWKERLLVDSFGVEPDGYNKDFPLNFRSKDKLSRKEFKQFYVSDTLKLIYLNGDKKDTLFGIIGKKDQ